MMVGIGGVRSRLTERSFHCNGLSSVRRSQGFERYVNPSNGGRGVDVITGQVWYKPSRRGRE